MTICASGLQNPTHIVILRSGVIIKNICVLYTWYIFDGGTLACGIDGGILGLAVALGFAKKVEVWGPTQSF